MVGNVWMLGFPIGTKMSKANKQTNTPKTNKQTNTQTPQQTSRSFFLTIFSYFLNTPARGHKPTLEIGLRYTYLSITHVSVVLQNPVL